ncbi:MAG TPA: methyltransferase domain-containing protein, partial [Xanthobacteraceae bacterium]
LDVGCGTGALTHAILAQANPRAVVGIDASERFVTYARDQTRDPRAAFKTADALTLTVDAGTFDAAVAGLVLNFVSAPSAAVVEMARAVRPGGTIAAYVWDYADGMQMMRSFWDAAVALDPTARDLDEARRFPLCRPEPLCALFDQAGLQRTDVRAIEVPTVFKSFDDYWSPFLGGQGPAPTYCMALPEDRRGWLRDRIRAALPAAPDGSIHLSARAFVVRGVKPS